MSKKYTKNKTATFALEPDGFSIHTVELSRELGKQAYQTLKDSLYKQQKRSGGRTWIHKDPSCDHGHICTLYSECGVRIQLRHNSKDCVDTFFVRMVVNPRKLIDPASSYLGILPPKESSITSFAKAFKRLFAGTLFDNNIDNYYLTRADLCANIRCDNSKLFRELVRALRKLPTPPKYERKLYKCEDKKKANRYNKHYLRFHCGTHDLIIYDKTYQIRNGNLVIGYEKLPEGVLRFEVHCERAYLRKVEKESRAENTSRLLAVLIDESRGRITRHFSHSFADVRFARKEELDAMIDASSYQKNSKAAMLALADSLQRIQSVDKALEKLKKAEYDTDQILDRFSKLGISPIPLRKNFCAASIPGPVELLRSVSSGDVEVPYIKVKYK